MNAILFTILFGFLSMQGGHTTYPYIYTEPLLPEIPYFHQYNIPQYYVQPHYFYPNPPIEQIIPEIKKTNSTNSNTTNTEDEKFLGFGYRTQHDSGHSNVVFLQSSDSDQLGLSLAEEFGSKAIESSSSSSTKTIASDMVDSNAEKVASSEMDSSSRIQFPEEDGDQENVLEFLEKPATSFYTFYTFDTKVFPRQTFQPFFFKRHILNNKFATLFSRFGISSETRRGKAYNSEPQSAKLVELNDTKITNTTEKINEDSETTTQIISETTMDTTEDTTMGKNTTTT